jgi:hypothetical protein
MLRRLEKSPPKIEAQVDGQRVGVDEAHLDHHGAHAPTDPRLLRDRLIDLSGGESPVPDQHRPELHRAHTITSVNTVTTRAHADI